MTRPVLLLALGGLPGLHTQAVYHVLAKQMSADRPDTLVLCWPTDPYVSLGYHQVRHRVLDSAAAKARGVAIMRRRVGGGLTYLDENQVFYQFVFHHSRVPLAPAKLYDWQLRVPVAALKSLGVEARVVRVNEVEVGPRRIAGIGAGRVGDASIVVGNILLDFDYDAMIAVWPQLGAGFSELAAASVRERVTTLRREGVDVSQDQVQRALADEAAAALGRAVVPGELTDEERAALEPMAQRLSSEAFVSRHDDDPHAHRPLRLKISARAYVVQASTTWNGAALHGTFLLHDEVIERAQLRSSVHADLGEMASALCGVAFQGWESSLG